MKLVIGGSSGFVGTELVRQALSNPAITSIVALSRRETTVPAPADGAAKLTSLVCDDFENYPEHVRRELHDVDACIWCGERPTTPAPASIAALLLIVSPNV